jgi:hypothetical protein
MATQHSVTRFKNSPTELPCTIKHKYTMHQSDPAFRESFQATVPHIPTTHIYPTAVIGATMGNSSMSPSIGASSTASSPANVWNVFDSPDTPTHQLSGSMTEAFTPCTPPTIYSMVEEDGSLWRSENLLPLTKKEMLGPAMDESKADDNDEGYFHPKKLIRNMTKELQASKLHISNSSEIITEVCNTVAREHAAAAQGHFNLEPSFDFSLGNTMHISARTRSKTKAWMNTSTTNAPCAVKVETAKAHIGVGNKHVTQTPAPRRGLHVMFEHVLPSDIHNKLKSQPHKCVASLVKDSQIRCTNNAKGPLSITDGIFERLETHENTDNYISFLDGIEELVQVVMCGSHRNAALKTPKAEPRMETLRKFVSKLAYASTSERSDFMKWVAVVSGCEALSEVEQSTNNVTPVDETSAVYGLRPKHTPTSPPFATITTATTPTVRLSYSMEFIPYQPKWSLKLSISEALRRKIAKPLKPTDEQDGFIYIFWDRTHLGKVKIGRTNNLQRRLREWDTKCKRKHSYHGSLNGGGLVETPHVSRVEHLIHIELKDFREQRDCEGCGTTHQEWFNVSVTHAVKVPQQPYEMDPVSREWELREDMRESLVRICEPVPLEVAQPKQRRKSGGVKGASRKKGARRTM